jgi:hypothetical protein
MLDDSNSVALLHFDGTDGSTTFTDESGKIWTPTLTAQLSTDEAKFGTSSAYFDGTSRIHTPRHDDFDFAAGNFTVDFWLMYDDGGVATHRVMGLGGGVEGSLDLRVVGTQMSGYIAYGGVNLSFQWDWVTLLGTGVWTHFALVRVSGVLYGYRNGISGGSGDSGNKNLVQATRGMSAGGNTDDDAFYTGYMDEFRVSNIARWLIAFTPPTEQYNIPRSDDNVASWNPYDAGQNITITNNFLTATHA